MESKTGMECFDQAKWQAWMARVYFTRYSELGVSGWGKTAVRNLSAAIMILFIFILPGCDNRLNPNDKTESLKNLSDYTGKITYFWNVENKKLLMIIKSDGPFKCIDGVLYEKFNDWRSANCSCPKEFR